MQRINLFLDTDGEERKRHRPNILVIGKRKRIDEFAEENTPAGLQVKNPIFAGAK